MSWDKGGAAELIARLTAKTPEETRVKRPGFRVPLDQVSFDAPSQNQQAAQRASNLFAHYQNVNGYSGARAGGPESNDYSAQAERLMFQANQIQQKAATTRLKAATKVHYLSGGPKVTHSDVMSGPLVIDGVKGGQVTSMGNGNKKAMVNRFIAAISGKESGGNYGAVNSSSGALGKYQVMPSNVAGWSKEALGHSITASQYLHSPKLQEQVARHKLTQYFNQYGAGGAAAAWYGGPGAAAHWQNNNAGQGAYPSVRNYVQSILRAIR